MESKFFTLENLVISSRNLALLSIPAIGNLAYNIYFDHLETKPLPVPKTMQSQKYILTEEKDQRIYNAKVIN